MQSGSTQTNRHPVSTAPQTAAEHQRVLIVDDDPIFRLVVSQTLAQKGYSVTDVADLAGLRAHIDADHFDVILLDIHLAGENGLEALPWLVRKSPMSKVLVVTNFSSVDRAVEAIKLGAANFISKSTSPSRISDEITALLQSTIKLKKMPGPHELDLARKWGMIGESQAHLHLVDHIFRIKDILSTVLITGESGTGKELVARAIHNSSRRSSVVFRAINCGAIPDTLLESELFGHKRGAFTDAKTNRIGFFETCSEGTLLLDEIGEMPLSVQVKLLRVLQESEVTPLGGCQPVKVKTRVIASTNCDLQEKVRVGLFREDLYFRLSVIQINTPSLRERLSDLPLLVTHFLSEFGHKFAKPMKLPARDLLIRLMAHDWPGNIRELRNAIERGVALSPDGHLNIEDVFPGGNGSLSKSTTANGLDPIISKPLAEAKAETEALYLRRVLAATSGNISKAARISGIHRANLYRIMSRHQLSAEDFKGEVR